MALAGAPLSCVYLHREIVTIRTFGMRSGEGIVAVTMASTISGVKGMANLVV